MFNLFKTKKLTKLTRRKSNIETKEKRSFKFICDISKHVIE